MGFTDQLIIGIVGLIVGTLLGNEINRFLYRPRVIIRFKHITPLHSQSGFFWSLVVANYGRTVAINCIGTISLLGLEAADIVEAKDILIEEALPKYSEEKIDLEYPRHQLIKADQFREIKNTSLCWSKLGNPSQLNINPGMCQTLDICRAQYNTEKSLWYLIFPSELGWRKVRTRVKSGNIKGRILICPENEFPTILDFEIKPDEDGTPIFISNKLGVIKRFRRFMNRKKMYFDY